MKENIRNISSYDIEESILSWGEKKFRLQQIQNWIWKNGVTDFDKMLNISTELKTRLSEKYTFYPIHIKQLQQSADKTIKVLFELHDNLYIEGVIIPSVDRVTVCISSQVGCKLKCKFCATGTIGFKRNLDPGEIYDQVKLLNEQSIIHFNRGISNIVLMGMGEPLYNYKNVNDAIYWLTSKDGLEISPKRITLSTIGIPVMIKRMADDEIKYNLAVSLHSAIQEKREKIMPVAKNNTLDQLSESLIYFTKKTGKKITFEYVLLDGINNGPEDAKALIKYSSMLASKINIIEYNEVKGSEYKKSKLQNTTRFSEILKEKGLIVQIRKSRGEDIDAACGQLANKLIKN